MDGIIQMLPTSLRKFSTYIDFEGQQMAERTFQVTLSLFGIIGFIAGYVAQQLSVTMYSIGVGFIVSCILTLPPWPVFRRHPLNWQSSPEESTEERKSQPKQQPSGKKHESKKRR